MKTYLLAVLALLAFTPVFVFAGTIGGRPNPPTTSSTYTYDCPAGALYSTVTGAPCSGYSYAPTYSAIPGCYPGYLFSTVTGQSCSNGINTPSIQLLSSNFGGSVTQGLTYTIRWTAPELSTLSINLIGANGSEYAIASNLSASSGSYNWTIPASVPLGSNYKIAIGSGSTNIFSAPFSIITSANQVCAPGYAYSTLTGLPCNTGASSALTNSFVTTLTTPGYDMAILSPAVAYEKWTVGDGHIVSWSYPPSLAGKSVFVTVALINPQQSSSWVIYNNTVGVSSYSGIIGRVAWSLLSSADVASGQYNILVTAYDPSTGITHKGVSGPLTVLLQAGNSSIPPPNSPITIITPSAGATLYTGQNYTLSWTGFDSYATTNYNGYSMYLVGGVLGTSGSRFLGTVSAYAQSANITIPSDIPTGYGYQLQLSGAGASGANSASFTIIKAN